MSFPRVAMRGDCDLLAIIGVSGKNPSASPLNASQEGYTQTVFWFVRFVQRFRKKSTGKIRLRPIIESP
jgi:hypothetical protein